MTEKAFNRILIILLCLIIGFVAYMKITNPMTFPDETSTELAKTITIIRPSFATAFVNIFGNPAKSYSKKIPLKTDINIGDMVNCDGEILPIYKIVYDLSSGHMTIFVGRSVTDTIEFLKETSRKIEAIQKVLY